MDSGRIRPMNTPRNSAEVKPGEVVALVLHERHRMTAHGRVLRHGACADDDGAGQYTRTVRLSDGAGSFHTGWVTVRHDEGAQSLAVMVSPSLLPVLSQVLSRVSRLFDLT